MMTQEERWALLGARRAQIEGEIREAEIMLGLLKNCLARIDSLIPKDLPNSTVVTTLHGCNRSPADRMSEEEKQKVYDLADKGMTARLIAIELNRSRQAIHRLLRERSNESRRDSDLDGMAGESEASGPEGRQALRQTGRTEDEDGL